VVTIDISSNKMSLRDRKVGDQRDRTEVQASSIRWRLELRDKAHGNLEADNTGVGGLVTIRGNWTRQPFMIVLSRSYLHT
jgi:hypothetical protein